MVATSAPGSLALSLAPRLCFKSALNLPGRGFFLFFVLPLGFLLSSLRPTSRISILDLRNFNLIRRSSRARYPHSLLSFFFASIRYILVGFFNLRIIITKGFM
jgi:hypothetical protein